MSVATAALWLLTAAAGAACAGLVRVPLQLEERVAVAAVAGIVGSTAVTLLIGLVAGLGEATALLGPVVLTVLALAADAVLRPRALGRTWRESWVSTVGRARTRELWIVAAITVFAAVGFWRLFAHTLFDIADGTLVAGFSTVWADWSLHSTLASSFSVAGNLPPHDPIFSGGSLRYPFLPDLHSATLEATGASIPAALAVPSAVLCVAIVLLVVSLGRRLTGSLAVGIIAVLLCMVGGGLGFSGLWWDACRASGHGDADCAAQTVLVHPATAVDVLAHVPGVIGNQPRNYDNIANYTEAQVVGNIQWYTPLLGWWLPQRTFVYGFAVGTAVLLLVVAGLRAPPPARSPFVVAGLLAGVLPLVHVHSLIALAIVLPLLALGHRRREWLWLLGCTAVLAIPRLIQVAAGGHGVSDPACPAGGTRFPYFEVGWLSHVRTAATACSPQGFDTFDALGALRSLGRAVALLVDPTFWLFWLDNNGAVLVVAVVVGAGVLLRLLPRIAGDRVPDAVVRAGARLTRHIPDELLRFAMPFVAVFAVCNVVVFQTWDWDNTKLLAYWYLGASLLTAAWLTAWWRSGRWRAAAASVALTSLVLAAGLTLGRVLQQEAAHSGGGPYVWASSEDAGFARGVAALTPGDAVFLTHGDPTDPLLTIGGRTALMGYAGWLYSYGVDTGSREQDRTAIYAGCADPATACRVPGLLDRYGIRYVAVRGDDPGAAWFARTYVPLAISPGGVTVYDVHRHP